jgi:predicted nucleotidyltransferase
MNYSISSKDFDHPLLKPILNDLTEYFSSINIKFFVIGATARDIMLSIHGEKARRATHDLDIAIAISNWDEFKTIEEGIVKIEGFEKDNSQKQKFIYKKDFELNIVPFGDIMKEGDKVFWPPDEQIAMSVLGFAEVNKATLKIEIDKDVSINIAPLAGVFILKIVAWADRNFKTNKDADDIAFIINNYLGINEQRAVEKYYEEIYLDKSFSIETAGAKLLAIDINEILKSATETKEKIITIIETEIDNQEESRLINQMIETNTNFEYENTLQCLINIVERLKQPN